MINKSYKEFRIIKSIKRAMENDHKTIHNLFNNLEKEIDKNSEKSIATFNKLKWILEKHFFIEEKIIFNLYLSLTNEENGYINQLLMEHEKILWLLNSLEEELIDNKKPDFSEIRELLHSHSKFENEFFYPKLDEEISEEEKSKIFDRIEKIIIK